MEFLKNDYVGTGKKSAKKEVRTKSPDDDLEVIRKKILKKPIKKIEKKENKITNKLSDLSKIITSAISNLGRGPEEKKEDPTLVDPKPLFELYHKMKDINELPSERKRWVYKCYSR